MKIFIVHNFIVRILQQMNESLFHKSGLFHRGINTDQYYILHSADHDKYPEQIKKNNLF